MPKRLTRQQAINAKCKDCSYDHMDVGTWRQQVTICGGIDCALYPYRQVDSVARAMDTPSLPAVALPMQSTAGDDQGRANVADLGWRAHTTYGIDRVPHYAHAHNVTHSHTRQDGRY